MNQSNRNESMKEKVYSVILNRNFTMKTLYMKFAKKYLLSFLIVHLYLIGSATNYYVSNSGSDSNSGLSPDKAWQTVSRINSGSFLPGDSIRFERGGIWRNQIIFPSSGKSGLSIVITAYGSGDKPKFSSPIGVATWTDLGGGLFSCVSFIHDQYSIFWEDNKAYQMATSSSCTDGLWFYSSGTLFYRPSFGSPIDHVINYADRNWSTNYSFFSGINISDRSYLTISELKFETLGNGIVSWDSGFGTRHITIDSCEFYFCHTGIFMMPYINNNTFTVIDNNYFKWCQNAIRMYTALATSKPGYDGGFQGTNDQCIISDNEMFECGTTDGSNLWTFGTDYEAIGLQNVTNSSIFGNYVHGGFQKGFIIFNLDTRKSENNRIYNNIIENNGNKSPIEFTGETGQDGFNNNWIYYNFIKDTKAPSSFVWNQGDNANQTNYFLNNTVTGAGGFIKVYTINPALYLSVENNIFNKMVGYYFRCDGNPSKLILDYNLYNTSTAADWYFNAAHRSLSAMQSLGYELHSQIRDPKFISTSDFHLQYGSPAINTGNSFGFTKDIEANSISGLPDIGAYEYKSNIKTTERISICEGTSYNGWTTTGTYTRTLTAKSGADSIVTTYLTVNPTYTITKDTTIQAGETYNGWTKTGTYTRTLSSVSGCDSTIITNLTVVVAKQGEVLPTHFISAWQNQTAVNPMNIKVVSATKDGLPLAVNDEIALYSGSICVGAVKLTQPIDGTNNSTFVTIPASQNDGSGNGFTTNDTIVVKIWDDANHREMVVQNVRYLTNDVSWLTTGRYSANATSVIEFKSYTEITQTISLVKGYNMMSTFVSAENPNVSAVTKPLIDAGTLVKVQDEYGNSYENWGSYGGWVNNLGNLKSTEGYKIKVATNCVLKVTGQPIALPLDITLNAGWNIISFPHTDIVNAMNVIQPLIDQNKLVKIQDEQGNSIEDWGAFGGWVNGIGNFIPGKAYKVKVNSNTSLTIR